MFARNITIFHSLFLVGAVMAIGYGADNDRDPRTEAAIAGVPVRFISVMFVAFGSVGLLALAITAPNLFLGELDPRTTTLVTFRALSVAAVFSAVGVVTTDSLF